MKNWAAIPYAIVVALVLGVGTYIGLDIADKVPGILTTKDTPTLAPPPALPSNVAAIKPDASQKPEVKGSLNESAIKAAVDKFGQVGNVAAIVSDTYTGKVIAELNADKLMIPASNMKSPTTINAYMTLGAEKHFYTKTYLDGTSLYLRGGGDMLLGAGQSDPGSTIGYAGIATLADQTVQQLKAAGVSSVDFYYDTSYWHGDIDNPDWLARSNYNFVGEITPMAIDRGRKDPHEMDFKHNIAQEVASTFMARLKADGITVKNSGSQAATPLKKARELASVESAPLGDVAHMLMKGSDNTLAEAVCRNAAVADGKSGNFADSTKHMEKTIASLGIDVKNLKADDCSGLSYKNRVNVRTLNNIFDKIAQGTQPNVKSIYSDLPVGGLDGTLHNRFHNLSDPGRIMAKTGTLDYATALSGFVVTDSGHVLTFSIIDNQSSWPSHIDDLVSAIAGS